MKYVKGSFIAVWATLLLLSCTKDKEGQLDLVIKLKYQDQALIVGDDYAFPDGRMIEFSRVSFYTSDMYLGDHLLSEVAFLKPTDDHKNASSAETGQVLNFENIPSGKYSSLRANIGLTANQNATIPANYTSDHPLAKPGEYWNAWDSYIFVKVEGNFDSNDDGTFVNDGFTLHLGSDQVMRMIESVNTIEISSDQTSVVNLEIDLLDFFVSDDGTLYDIDANKSIHSLSQLPQAHILADNFKNAITFK